MNNGETRAFPISLDGHHFDGGLTKREYFAAMAMQGLCANSIPVSHTRPDQLIGYALEYADELLKQLEQK